MTATTLSSREFNQDTGRAKKASLNGPVIITDRGKPAHVLMSIDQYNKLVSDLPNIIELIASPAAEKIEFTPERLKDLGRTVDFS